MPLDLGQLYDDHAPALFAFLLNLTRSEPEARDLLQEIFVRIAERPSSLDRARELRSYLIRLAHNLFIDSRRAQSTRDNCLDRFSHEPVTLFTRTQDPDSASFQDALTSALGELPPDQRAVVHLKLWEEWTFAEIADALGIPLNTAASRYRYALDKLQSLLRPLYDELQ